MPWEPSLHVKGVVSLTHPHSSMRGCKACYGKRSDSRKHHIAIQWCWRPQNPQNNKHSRSLMERDSLSKGMISAILWCVVNAIILKSHDEHLKSWRNDSAQSPPDKFMEQVIITLSLTLSFGACLISEITCCTIMQYDDRHLQWITTYEHNIHQFQMIDLFMTHIT